MKEGYSYRDSHTYAQKGAEYEAYYETRSWQRFLWSREQEVLLKILEKYFAGREIHLLDFACGTGRVTSFLENRVKTSTGVDVSGSMLAVARKKLTRTEIIEADITVDDVLQGRSFNLITAFRFFLNAEPSLRSAAMEALARLLSDDGYLVFNNHQSYGSLWIKLRYMHHRWKERDPARRLAGFNVMTIGEMKKLAEGVGLRIVELYPVGFFNPPRVPVPEILRDTIERTSCRFGCLRRFSESPVAVCCRQNR